MLVLSRRLQEKIVIPGLDVTIQVVSIKPGSVRLGIEAPPEISVLREELRDRETRFDKIRRQPDGTTILVKST